MRRRPRHPHVSFDDFVGDLFPESLTDVPRNEYRRPHRVRALAGLLSGAVALGLIGAGWAAPTVAAGGIGAREAATYYLSLPDTLPQIALPQRTTVLAADGSLIAEFYSENRVTVTLDQVPHHVRDAFLAIEDSRFYHHNGLDAKGILRAVRDNFEAGVITGGGSTITQQYVKNVLLLAAETDEQREAVTSRTSYVRKLREARYALALEARMSKDEIFEGYLNIAYFGDGAYGVGAAASHYFNKPVTDLTVDEGALLAGLVKNPVGYDPTVHPAAAKDRRNLVLDRMAVLDMITPTVHDAAAASPVTLDLHEPANGCATSRYALYCQWVKQILATDPTFGPTPEIRQQRLYEGGVTIRTALDPTLQDHAQQAVDDALGRANQYVGAAVTVQPGTGRVVAMAVNRGFGKDTDNGETEILLPTLPAYQPGSTMKIFTLAAALETGWPLHRVWDSPTRYKPDGQAYPEGGFRNTARWDSGPMDAQTAIWRSSNTWFVHLQKQVGVVNTATLAYRVGITSTPLTGKDAVTERDASFTLGTYETSPLQVANGFATFAARGVTCNPVAITDITGLDGIARPIPDPDCRQTVSPAVADTINAVMQGVIDGPDEHRTGADVSLGRPAAGKTGTTDNFAAAWFTGYTPDYSTSVWVGDPRGSHAYPLRTVRLYGKTVHNTYGASVAGPIWKDVMTRIHEGLPATGFAPADPATIRGTTLTVPDVRGMDRDSAVTVLTSAGFTVALNPSLADPDPVLTPGHVQALAPAPASRVGWGATITLTLTDGSDLSVRIPPGDDTPRR